MSHQRLLTLLTQSGQNWLSGQEISRQLGVSRTAIWKQIEALRAAGYGLEAQTRRGYRLVSLPDAVTPLAISAGLSTHSFGQSIHYCGSVGSTNDEAKRLARDGAPEGLLVIANEQTAGKGRLGRGWATPPGSAIAMSLVLRPNLPPFEAPRTTLVAAVAVAEAVCSVTGLQAGIKWPNDVQVNGLKICGILTELEADMDRIGFVVCGIGLNVNMNRDELPDEYRQTATSLRTELSQPVARASLVREILTRFESAYEDLITGRFAQVLDRWRARSVTLGHPVQVHSVIGTGVLVGIAEDLDSDGALLVRTEAGVLQRVHAGEVSLRPKVKGGSSI